MAATAQDSTAPLNLPSEKVKDEDADEIESEFGKNEFGECGRGTPYTPLSVPVTEECMTPSIQSSRTTGGRITCPGGSAFVRLQSSTRPFMASRRVQCCRRHASSTTQTLTRGDAAR